MISVIIPVYNSAAFLPKTLDSLTCQTYPDLQIICVNDGSTDASGAILENYAVKDKRIEIISQTNRGISAARNAGLRAMRGQYVLFLDADDWLDADTCEAALRHQQEKDADVVMWGYQKEYGGHSSPVQVWEENRLFEGEGLENLHCRLVGPRGAELAAPEHLASLGTVWGKLYKADIVKNVSFADINEIGTSEDELFNIHVFSHVRRALYVCGIWYHYRKSGVSYTKKKHKGLKQQWEKLFALMEMPLAALPYRQKAREALQNRKALSLIGLGLNIIAADACATEKYTALSGLLHTGWYRESISSLPLCFFPPHWKVFFLFAKMRFTAGVFILLSAIRKIIST